MAGISVLGTGSYTPPGTLTNQMLEQLVDTSDEWITTRTGIHRRAIAEKDESSLSMSLSAARIAIESAGIDTGEIGVVVSATLTGDYLTPSLSCLLQRDLGLREEIIPIDVNCACSGFIFALKTAFALLEDRPESVALVTGCEMLSRITDYTDRTTCILFGDGAGATIIKRTDAGTFHFDGGAMGNSELLVCKARYLDTVPFAGRTADYDVGGLSMKGADIFRFALEAAPKSIGRVLERAESEPGSVDHYVFHQANRRIVDGLIRHLGIDAEQCIVNIDRLGNTSSASVPIALDELARSGRLKRGDSVVLSAFGGGLTYASAYFIW